MNAQVTVNPDYNSLVTEDWIGQLVSYVLDTHFQHQDAQVSIALENDQEVHNLNLQYRAVDSTTDVLSFEGGYPDPESGYFHLGDIIVSVPQTQKQAAAAKHPFKQELALLIVHGILHLKGYDHAEPQDKEIMWKEQDQILDKVKDSLLYE